MVTKVLRSRGSPAVRRKRRAKSTRSAKTVGVGVPAVYTANVQEKRNAVIERALVAATRRLNRQGFVNMTMEQIAGDLELLPGALYHYVEDKEQLAYLCLLRGCEMRSQQLQDADEAGVDGLEKIRRYLRRLIRTGQPRIPVFNEVSALEAQKRDHIRALIRRNNQQLRGFIQEGIDDGSVVSADADLTALAIISIVDWISFWYTDRLGYARAAVAEQIDDLITHGLYRRNLPRIEFPPMTAQTQPHFPEIDDPVQARKDRVLRAALTVFNRYGFAGAVIDRVAQALGVSRTVIYRYCRDKEDLLYQCLERAQHYADLLFEQIPHGANVVEEEVWVRRYSFSSHASPHGPQRTFSVLAALTPEHREKVMSDLNIGIAKDFSFVNKGLAQQLYRNIDPFVAERVRAGLIGWFPVWFSPQGKRSATDIADNHTALLMYGLKPRSR